jgi:hypothetical protein
VTDKTPSLSDDAKAFLAALEAPLMAMAQAAINKVVPPQFAGPATVVLDAVDATVHALNPSVPAALAASNVPTVAAAVPEDAMAALTARVTALEAHVAALTVATGHDTSAVMVAAKAAATVAVAKPAA